MRKQRLCLAAGVLALCLAACAPAISAQQAAAPASLPSSSRVETMESNLTSLPPSSAVQQPESSSLPASSAAESTESTPPSSAAPQASRPDSFRLADFPVLYQMPELPTGCEITALTMVLHFYGYPVDKTTMAADYLPKARANLHEGADGRLYGGDLRNYFIGDPFTEAGYICGTGAIVTAANTYLQDAGSSLQAVDESGAAPEQLYDFVSEGTPVVVWVTIGMADRRQAEGWYTEDGTYVDWSTNDHGAVLIGYAPDTVTIADPLAGIVEYSRSQFESVYAERGSQCVLLRDRSAESQT